MEQSCQCFPSRVRNPSTFGDESFLPVWCQLKKNHAILFVFSRRTSHSPHPFLSQLFLLETWSRPKGQIFTYVKKKKRENSFLFLLEQPQEKWLSRERAQIFQVGSRSPWTPCPQPSRDLIISVDCYCLYSIIHECNATFNLKWFWIVENTWYSLWSISSLIIQSLPSQGNKLPTRLDLETLQKNHPKKLFSKRAIVNGNQIQKPAQSELFHIFIGEEWIPNIEVCEASLSC